jgi:hypothetical protein
MPLSLRLSGPDLVAIRAARQDARALAWLAVGPSSYDRRVVGDVGWTIGDDSPARVADAIAAAAMSYVRAAARGQVATAAHAAQRHEDNLRAALGLASIDRPPLPNDEGKSAPIAERHLAVLDAVPDLGAYFAACDNWRALRRQGEQRRWTAVREWRLRGLMLLGIS